MGQDTKATQKIQSNTKILSSTLEEPILLYKDLPTYNPSMDFTPKHKKSY